MVGEEVSLREGLDEMSRKSLGMTAIVDDQRRLLGVFTDGDLRRALDDGIDVHNTEMKTVMHRDCKVVGREVLAAEAMRMLEDNKITSLLVVDDDHRLIGALNIHDLFRAGMS
jgi:arabinose-5-phosphate isomerase